MRNHFSTVAICGTLLVITGFATDGTPRRAGDAIVLKTDDAAPVSQTRMVIESGSSVTAIRTENSFLQINGISAPAASGAGTGRIYFDSTSNVFKVSENAGIYSNLVGGSGVPSGYMILGDTSTAPSGYTYTGNTFAGAEGDQWTTKTAMTQARRGAVVVAVNGKIYVIGGRDWGGGIYYATNEEYNPSNDTWTTKTAMTTARAWPAAAVVNGKIYVIAGYKTGSGYTSTNEAYDPSANSWSSKASMASTRGYAAAAAFSDRILVIGGINTTQSAEEYYPAMNRWTTRASLPAGRSQTEADIVNGKIYFAGGDTGSAVSATNYEYSTVPFYYAHKKN